MGYLTHSLMYPDTVEERCYQTAIADAAVESNTLVVLPTALGKTVISALVVASQLYNHKDKRVLVMAPTRPLVAQHKASFERMLRLPSEEFVMLTGRTPAELRSATWTGPARLIFATPQVVRNDILNNGLQLDAFGLLVFDECHRAVKDYAYTEVARQYVKTSPYPLILGMTASPGSDLNRVRTVCEALAIEHVEYRSDEDPDVKQYIHPVHLEGQTVQLPGHYTAMSTTLREMLYGHAAWLQSRGYLSSTNITRKWLIELGSELRYKAELSLDEERGPFYFALMHTAAALTLLHMVELLESQGAPTLKAFMNRSETEDDGKPSRRMVINDPLYNRLKSLLDGQACTPHPKVELLLATVHKQLNAKPGGRVLVFTQYRDTASHLVEELNKVAGIRAERFVGQGSKTGDKGLTQDQQAALIGDLKSGVLNVLVATSIAEEGLDIPEVELVVFYEPIPSEIRYIQRRGRTGRRTAGKVMILAAVDTLDMVYLSAAARRVERMRAIAAKLNSLLTPVLRSRVTPPLNQMTKEELAALYAKTVVPPEPPLVVDTEKESLREFQRQVLRAERTLYMRILEQGIVDVNDKTLQAEMEAEGFSNAVLTGAIKRLAKDAIVQASPRGDVVTIPTVTVPGARLLTITVERILAGEAVVWIDDKWRARLAPEDYNGPRQLLKKNVTFKAMARLYRADDGALCVSIHQVVQTVI